LLRPEFRALIGKFVSISTAFETIASVVPAKR
jgi:hypothetical protein